MSKECVGSCSCLLFINLFITLLLNRKLLSLQDIFCCSLSRLLLLILLGWLSIGSFFLLLSTCKIRVIKITVNLLSTLSGSHRALSDEACCAWVTLSIVNGMLKLLPDHIHSSLSCIGNLLISSLGFLEANIVTIGRPVATCLGQRFRLLTLLMMLLVVVLLLWHIKLLFQIWGDERVLGLHILYISRQTTHLVFHNGWRKLQPHACLARGCHSTYLAGGVLWLQCWPLREANYSQGFQNLNRLVLLPIGLDWITLTLMHNFFSEKTIIEQSKYDNGFIII